METHILKFLIEILAEFLYIFATIDYFEIFFENKKVKGIYVYVFAINMLVQIMGDYLPYYPDYCRIVCVLIAIFGIRFFLLPI